MAVRKSNRPPSRSDGAGTNHPRAGRGSGAQTKRGPRAPIRIEPASQGPDVMRRLVLVALRLKVIYGTALAVEFALRHQDADQDVELAECLRAGVCNPIGEQAEAVRLIVEQFGSFLPEPLP